MEEIHIEEFRGTLQRKQRQSSIDPTGRVWAGPTEGRGEKSSWKWWSLSKYLRSEKRSQDATNRRDMSQASAAL